MTETVGARQKGGETVGARQYVADEEAIIDNRVNAISDQQQPTTANSLNGVLST